jgi:hypothetical protein
VGSTVIYGTLVVDLERKRPTRMQEGKVGEWKVRQVQFEKIPLSIPLHSVTDV